GFFLSLALSDRTGRLPAVKWDAREEEAKTAAPGDAVRVKGFVENYKGQKQIVVRHLAALPPGAADLSEFLPSSPLDPARMLGELRALLDEVRRPPLRALVEAYLGDEEFAKAFSRAPAAAKLHHAYLGGLLEHTLALTKAASAVAGLYPSLDRDFLLVGAFLHDTGKVEELSCERTLGYTDRGRLLGHISIGSALLARKAASVEGFPADLLDRLMHIVLSHHGLYEYGSPRLPMTAEAVVLHLLDDLDAKVKVVESLRDGERKGNWSDFQKSFERSFYMGEEGGEGEGGEGGAPPK
ncbi:MAG: HD domain-containing protein, partial [Planctomycetes bacterium]|nr:HD domain-containing protein [Planctomycetota bacterium]